jgi:murein DD-endopeptidase MepM/ murein hydrolase activator NlpD
MSNRTAGKAFKAAALVSIIAGAAALSGCTALGSRAFADRTTTGSISSNGQGSSLQPMPKSLGETRVAANHFIPPADIGGGGSGMTTAPAMMPVGQPTGSVSSNDLPVLNSSTSQGNGFDMTAAQPAQPLVAPVPVQPKVETAAVTPVAATPNLVSVPKDAYVHQIASGESLYTIARQYGVTAQAIIQANGFNSPDKIFVGQKIVIPGRPDLLAKKGPAKPVTDDQPTSAPVVQEASLGEQAGTPIASPKLVEPEQSPAKPLVQPKVEPVLSGADKFRWPASGRVITDFANSKGTGINIELPEGAAVRSAENGQVIYVGSGVEGYGNLVLIRHPNGYVSAYAHLKSMSVNKGDVVNRGDNIGAAGMTGGVSRPQLHFELRKGATPVDPVPLLAS